MKTAKSFLALTLLIFFFSASAVLGNEVRDDLCEEELEKCQEDCSEWSADVYRGACYVGCSAGYLLCELFIED